VLYFVLPLVWLIDRATATNRRGLPALRREAAQLAGIGLLSLLVLSLAYGFQDSFRPLGEFSFQSRILAGGPPRDPAQAPGGVQGNRFRSSWLGRVPVPLPAQYVLGVDEQRVDFESLFPSYLRGEWKRGGWWYYYIYGLAIKEPI